LSPDWLRFWAWAFPGALLAAPWLVDAFGVESRVAVFAPWLAAAAACGAMGRLGKLWPAILGTAEGAGAVLLLIALVDKTRTGCDPCSDPQPWLIAGLATIAGGIVAFVVARRLGAGGGDAPPGTRR
jgi:hypothetical protein